MRKMETIEYSFISSELKAAEGKHFSNAYKLRDGKYRLKIGDFQIILEPGVRLNFAKYIEDAIEPDQIVLLLKKHLDNLKLTSVYQKNEDRLIVFDFGEFSLVFEGFGEGNLVLVKEGLTVVAMREESWSDREIRKGKQYNFPKSKNASSFREAISEKYVISALLRLPLGKEYAKEILKICSVPETKPGNSLSANEISKIEVEIKKLLSNLSPMLFFSSDEIQDYGLCNFSKNSSFEAKHLASLSEAIDEFYFKSNPEKNEKLEKLERRLEEQTSRLESLNTEVEATKSVIDGIYVNYEKIESILNQAKKSKLDSLEKELEKYSAKVDKKNKEIEFEL